MKKNIFLGILILAGVFLQGSESKSEEHIDKSPKCHIRRKRVIDTSHNRNETFLRQEIPYVVRVLNEQHVVHCTGIILNPRIFLTAAHCVHDHKVFIATGNRRHTNTQIHGVVAQFIHESFDPILNTNDLALLLINNNIDLTHSFHRPIELYEGHLPPNSHGLVSGWGFTKRDEPERPSQPLSILVPIISQEQCQHAYGSLATVSPRQLCTHATNRTKCCWFGDSGAPLVVNGRLVAVFACFYPNNDPRLPDVYMNLMSREYRKWIKETIHRIQSRHHS